MVSNQRFEYFNLLEAIKMPLEEFELPELEQIKNAKKLLSTFKKTIKVPKSATKPLNVKESFKSQDLIFEEMELPDLKKLKK